VQYFTGLPYIKGPRMHPVGVRIRFRECRVSPIPLIATHQRIFQPREVIKVVVQIGRSRYYLLAISDRVASFVLECLYNK
jgi:hypothetical protein